MYQKLTLLIGLLIARLALGGNGFAQSYCTPQGNTYGNGLSFYGISGVQTTGATVNFNNQQTSLIPFNLSTGYENYSSQFSATVA